MGRVPSFCGVILAAGESLRMGTDKALLPWPPPPDPDSNSGSTFLSSAIRLLSPFNDMVFVVAGKNASTIAPVVYANGAFLIENPDPARGQFSSLRIGLQEVLTRGRDSVMLTLVDRPPVRPETVENLVAAFLLALGAQKWAVVPERDGKHGHPILIGRDMVEAFLKAPETATARDVEHQHWDKIRYVSIPDSMIAVNINTPEDYAALRSTQPGIRQ